MKQVNTRIFWLIKIN